MKDSIEIPPLSASGRFPRPIVLLLGGQNGVWQANAAKGFRGYIIRTDVSPSVSVWETLIDLIDAADLIVCWCGNGPDRVHLNEWIFLSHAITRHREKMVVGIEAEPDHPMSNGIRFLLQWSGIVFYKSFDATISAARERCRVARGGNHGIENRAR